MWQHGQKRDIPEGGGKQIRFFRYHEIATATTALTEGTNPDPTAITGHEVNRTLEEWGGFSQHSSLVSRTHIDRGLARVSELWGDQAGRTIDLRIMKEVVTNGAHAIRADNAASGAGMPAGCWSGTVTSATTSTTGIIYTGDMGSSTDNWWIGGQILFTSGANYGQSRYISDSTAATHAIGVSLALESIPATGDTFILSHPGKSGTSYTADAMDTTDVISHKTMTKVFERMKTTKAMPFSGGYYVFIIGPTVHAGFLSDATWIPVQQYAGGGGLLNGEIGRYMNFRFLMTSQPFRCTLPTTVTTGGPGQSSTTYQTSGSNYSATGTGHYSLALGQEAYGVTKFPGWNQPKIIVKNPGPNDTSNPLNRYSTVGWELPFVPCALNGLWAVTVVSGA